MEKARRSLRRSATRLISNDESESHLNVAMQEWKTVKNAANSFAGVQREAAEFLLKWSLKEENRAIKDSAFQLNELVRLWTSAQSRFAVQLQTAVDELANIRDVHKIVREAEKRVAACVEKEEKIKRELQAACRWRKGGDIRLLQYSLQEATCDRRLAEQRVNETKLEQEVAKMLRFKKSMNIMAQSYLNMGQACTVIFEAHRDISNQIPDACDVGLAQLPYVQYIGAPFTRQRVEVARRRMSEIVIGNRSSNTENSNAIDQRRRASDTAAHGNRSNVAATCFNIPRMATAGHLEPPPPYAP